MPAPAFARLIARWYSSAQRQYVDCNAPAFFGSIAECAENQKREFQKELQTTEFQVRQVLFYGVSEGTLYKRFMRTVNRTSHEELQYYLDVNYETNMVLVLETCDQDKESQLIGIAQYFLDQASRYADIAFIVRASALAPNIYRVSSCWTR